MRGTLWEILTLSQSYNEKSSNYKDTLIHQNLLTITTCQVLLEMFSVYKLIESSRQHQEISIPILQRRKWRLREVRQALKGRTADKWWSWGSGVCWEHHLSSWVSQRKVPQASPREAGPGWEVLRAQPLAQGASGQLRGNPPLQCGCCRIFKKK